MVTSAPTPTAVSRPLNILIAGAGIGGLAAATALRQAGHLVQVFERSLFSSEYGAAVSITPNANGPLRRIGLALEDIGGVSTKQLSEYSSDGVIIRCSDTADLVAGYKYPWQYVHRVDLHNGLKTLATTSTGAGKPVRIHLGCRAVSIDPKAATLTLENGVTHSGDLVIVADGVNSTLRPCIDGSNAHPTPFGISLYRFLIPTYILSSDPQTRRFVENSGELAFWGSSGRRIVLYPCRDGKLLNCGCILDDNHPERKKEWDGAKCKEEILKAYKDFHPDVVALLNKADPAAVKFWPLFDMPTLNTWTSGRAALMGDAAHPFLPFQGQGAAQAIEDGVTLGVLLSLGTKPEDVEGRLRLYEKARFERVTSIQEASRVAGREGDEEAKKSSLILKTMRFNFGHDARAFAEGLLNESLAELHVEG